MNTAGLVIFVLIWIAPQSPQGMAPIPAGEFWMGRTHFFLIDEVGWLERDRRDDLPAHKVSEDAFYLDKYEVTNEEYARFAEAAGKPKLWYWPGGKIPKGGTESRGTRGLQKKCGRSTTSRTLSGGNTTSGIDAVSRSTSPISRRRVLPCCSRTLAPWTQPVRMATPQPRTVRRRLTTAVGSYLPNGFGLYDMVGNVWEWNNDWYDRDYYSVSPDRNPTGPATGIYKVIRGGGWSDDDERNFMNHYRNYADPSVRTYTIGFRCAKSVGG